MMLQRLGVLFSGQVNRSRLTKKRSAAVPALTGRKKIDIASKLTRNALARFGKLREFLQQCLSCGFNDVDVTKHLSRTCGRLDKRLVIVEAVNVPIDNYWV